MNIKATVKTINYQGTTCYLPAIVINPDIADKGMAITHVSLGDPLVFRQDALKYANIWRNESISAGYVTHF